MRDPGAAPRRPATRTGEVPVTGSGPRSQGTGPKKRRRNLVTPIRLVVGSQEFIKTGLSRFDLRDPYYFAVSLNWRRFALLFLIAELAINTVFATLYTIRPGAIANQPASGTPFVNAFYFSLETLATVGYGEMYPGTTYGHVVSSLEIVIGTVFTAIVTGLLFVRFSKPRAKMLYAAHPVVTTNNGQRTLMLRIGNARASLLHNATATIHSLVRTVSQEGQQQANVVELPLARSRMPAFAVLWTLMHVIDEASPLHNLTSEEMEAVRLFIAVSAWDPAMGQQVSDVHTIAGADIRVGMRYVRAIRSINDTQVVADYGLLSLLEPDGVELASDRSGDAQTPFEQTPFEE